MPFVPITSLTASGIPSPPGVVADVEEAVQLAVPLVDRAPVGLPELGAADLLSRRRRAASYARQPQRVDHREPPGGTLKNEPSRSGAFASASSTESDWLRLVLGPDVDDVERVRGRRHVGEVELRDLRDRRDDVVQLRAEALELVVASSRRARCATWSSCSRSIGHR